MRRSWTICWRSLRDLSSCVIWLTIRVQFMEGLSIDPCCRRWIGILDMWGCHVGLIVRSMCPCCPYLRLCNRFVLGISILMLRSFWMQTKSTKTRLGLKSKKSFWNISSPTTTKNWSSSANNSSNWRRTNWTSNPNTTLPSLSTQMGSTDLTTSEGWMNDWSQLRMSLINTTRLFTPSLMNILSSHPTATYLSFSLHPWKNCQRWLKRSLTLGRST